MVRQKIDKIKERERKKSEDDRNMNLLKDVEIDEFERRKDELKGEGEDGRWLRKIENNILKKIGKVKVEDIDKKDIREKIEKIWNQKDEKERKDINRIEI